MREEPNTKLGGPDSTVEVDETFVGGVKRGKGVWVGKQVKQAVLGIAERGGSIHMQIIRDRSVSSIAPVLNDKLAKDTKQVVTDQLGTYAQIIPEDMHKRTSHKEELNNKNWTSTQTVENAFSLFKRGIVGNYHWLSPWHLDRYLREFCWRYNRRGVQPWMFEMALTNLVNRKPLPYKELTKF
jgi:hypothetical protein